MEEMGRDKKLRKRGVWIRGSLDVEEWRGGGSIYRLTNVLMGASGPQIFVTLFCNTFLSVSPTL